MIEHLNLQPVNPARVVIMGASGFVGSAIRRRLEKAGVGVLALGRGEVDLLAAGAADRLALLLRPTDAFVAVAALAPVKNLDMLQSNIVMLRAMVGALTLVPPAHLLNIGSDAVFGDEPLPLTEDAPKAAGSLHGIMHAAREIAFAEIKAPLATLRPTLIYGADDPHNGYGPNRFRRLAADNKEIVLFGEGEERRDHVLVDDVAELAYLMLMHRSCGSLNCVTGRVWSFRDIASIVANLFERPVPVRGSPRQGPMPHDGHRPFNPAAISAAFPDFRCTPLPEGLAKVHADTRSRVNA
ncbi:MAG: NAD(P)-dependent oxidoreductase [Rhodospirillaceae bacterium]